MNASDKDGTPGSTWYIQDWSGEQVINSTGDQDSQPLFINDTDLGINFTIISKSTLALQESQMCNPIIVRARLVPDKKADYIMYPFRSQPTQNSHPFYAMNGTASSTFIQISQAKYPRVVWDISPGVWYLQRFEVWGNTSINASHSGATLKDFGNWTNYANMTGTNTSLWYDQVGFGLSSNYYKCISDNFRAYGVADQNYLDTAISNITAVAIFSDAEGDGWANRTCMWDWTSDGTIDYEQSITSPTGLNVNCTVHSES